MARPATNLEKTAQAHHVKHIKFGGTALVDNCVILCSNPVATLPAHEGGNYGFGSVVGNRADYPFFNG